MPRREHMSPPEPSELVQVVLDDATVDRLRLVAAARGVELEQLIVNVLHLASCHPDAPDSLAERQEFVTHLPAAVVEGE